MKNRSHSAVRQLIVIAFLCVSAGFLDQAVPAQDQKDAQLKSALTFCLFQKFPGVKGSLITGRETTLFDPDSGRNFAWDNKKQAWIDVKTGEVICSRSKSALTFCLFEKFPGVKGSLITGRETTLYDPNSGRNFAWDKDKQAWIDIKTLECVCPSSCPTTSTATTTPPPTPSPEPPRKPTPIFVRNYQPGEVFVGYMFLRAPGETAKNSSGFAVQMFYNFKPNLGIGGELACAWGSGRIGTTIDVSLQRCTYTFGPQINTKPNGKVQFFFHPLVGGVHDANKTTAGTLISKSSANALALSIGGGLNVKMNSHLEVRPIQADYQPTHFGGFWQHNVRISQAWHQVMEPRLVATNGD